MMAVTGQANDEKNVQPQPQLRWWDIPAAILLFIAIFTAASRLDATHWATDLSIIPNLVIFGVITGLALGQSRFKLHLIVFFGLVYGLYLVTWQFGLTDEGLPWKERLLVMSSRAGAVIHQIANGQTVTDSFLFILIMAILFWVLSLHAGYMLTRHGNAWWAILPTGLVIIAIHSFDPLVPRRALYTAVYLFFGLVLVARIVFLQQRTHWKQSRTALPPHLGLDFIRFALTTVVIVILVAWTAPVLAKSVPVIVEAAQPIRQSWANLRNRWENAFASLRSTVGIYSNYYGDNIILGRGNILSDTPVMVISPPKETPIGVRYYWRAIIYDDYANGQWVNTVFTEESFDPKTETLRLPEYKGRWEDKFEIIPATYLSTLFSPGQPFWVSSDSNAELAHNLDGTVDIAGFHSKASIRPQQPYQTQASVSMPTIIQLREAGTDYPDWVTDRYLKLPETLTPRTRQLAFDLTEGIDNPYDKVVAITSYLRSNITYQETVPPIPRGKEPIDWFLFDLKKGFCNYYATSEVLMLRSIGIPARLAVGYAQGERLDDGRFLARQRDAHSWPEVFFPGVGWVESEPTVSQPDIRRPSGEANTSSAGFSPDEELDELRRHQQQELEQDRLDFSNLNSTPTRPIWFEITLWFAAFALLVVIGFLVWKNRKRITFPAFPILLETMMSKIGIQPPRFIRQWAQRSALPPLTKSYQEINRALGRLGETPQITLTPAERAERLGDLLPPARSPAQQLLNEYQIATFSQQTPDYNTARQAQIEIRGLSIKARIQYIIKQFRARPTSKRTKSGNSFSKY